ncbi:MAG: hypothetical protein Q9172_007776 [Xanthocarpia lactea]
MDIFHVHTGEMEQLLKWSDIKEVYVHIIECVYHLNSSDATTFAAPSSVRCHPKWS